MAKIVRFIYHYLVTLIMEKDYHESKIEIRTLDSERYQASYALNGMCFGPSYKTEVDLVADIASVCETGRKNRETDVLFSLSMTKDARKRMGPKWKKILEHIVKTDRALVKAWDSSR